jgi:hypothetical protein
MDAETIVAGPWRVKVKRGNCEFLPHFLRLIAILETQE